MWLVLLFALASHRIVSTAPSITEILFALGAGDQVVGDTLYCNYPEAAKSKPKIGGFKTPNIELILALNPDLVFVNDSQTNVVAALRQTGPIEVITLYRDRVSAFIDRSGLSPKRSECRNKARCWFNPSTTRFIKMPAARIEPPSRRCCLWLAVRQAPLRVSLWLAAGVT